MLDVVTAHPVLAITSFEAASLLISGIGLPIIIVQLLHLQKQNVLLQKQNRAAGNAAAADRQLALDNLFIDHADLWPYFFEGEELATHHEDRFRVRSLAYAMANYLDSSFLQLDDDSDAIIVWGEEHWARYAQGQLRRAPAVANLILDHPQWYTARLRRLAEAARTETSSETGTATVEPVAAVTDDGAVPSDD